MKGDAMLNVSRHEWQYGQAHRKTVVSEKRRRRCKLQYLMGQRQTTKCVAVTHKLATHLLVLSIEVVYCLSRNPQDAAVSAPLQPAGVRHVFHVGILDISDEPTPELHALSAVLRLDWGHFERRPSVHRRAHPANVSQAAALSSGASAPSEVPLPNF